MTSHSQTLDGLSAIVTGAGRGTGAATARALAAAGASVCVNDLNPDRAEQVAGEIVEAGGEAFAWHGDISNKFQLSAMIEATRDHYGSHLHIFVHNAHVSPRGDALKIDEWNVRRTVEVNVIGSFLAVQLAARVMVDEGGGLIVMLTRMPEEPGAVLMAETQAAVGALARALGDELRGQNVRVEAVPAGEDAAQQIVSLAAQTLRP